MIQTVTETPELNKQTDEPTAHDLPRATNVCIRCKGRKKKCDKALPSCARCTKLKVRCQYTADVPETKTIPTPPESEFSSLSVLQDDIPHYFPEMISPNSFRVTFPKGTASAGEHQPQPRSFDEEIAKQVLDLMSRDGEEDLKAQLDFYLATVNQWLPVVAGTELLPKLLFLKVNPRSDIWALLLSIILIVKMTRHESADKQRLDQFYMTTKSLNAIIQAAGRTSVEMVQAGVLIALYEHCQVLTEAAYLTIGSCARMGYLLELNKTLSERGPDNPQAQKIIHNKRRVWWSIFILERVIKLGHLDSKLPFAIPTPNHFDLLPSNQGILIPVVAGLVFVDEPRPDLTHFIAQEGKLSLFGEIAQSAYLLGRVMDHVMASKDGRELDASASAARLDKTIHSYSMSLLELGHAGHHCWAYTLCLGASHILNRDDFLLQQRIGLSEIDARQSRASLALQSACRIGLDGLGSAPDIVGRDIDLIPIWGIYPTFMAGIAYIKNQARERDAIKFEEDFKNLISLFSKFAPKWRVAGKFVDDLEAAYRSYNPSTVRLS